VHGRVLSSKTGVGANATRSKKSYFSVYERVSNRYIINGRTDRTPHPASQASNPTEDFNGFVHVPMAQEIKIQLTMTTKCGHPLNADMELAIFVSLNVSNTPWNLHR